MEKRIRVRIGTVLNDNRIDILSEDGDSLLHDLCRVIEQELDKAREEGFGNCYKEVLAMDSFGEKMDMSRKESFRRLKNLLEDKIRLKLTTK